MNIFHKELLQQPHTVVVSNASSDCSSDAYAGNVGTMYVIFNSVPH